MRELRGVLLARMPAGHVPGDVGQLGRLLAGAVLGRAHAQVVGHRQRDAVVGLVMLQEVDHAVVPGGQHLVGAGLPRRDLLAVHRGHGVGHDEHVRVPAGGRGRTAGDHRLLGGLAGVAEVDVRIGQTRSDGQTGRVDVHVAVRDLRGGGRERSVGVGEQVGGGAGDDQVDDLAGIPHLDVMQGDHAVSLSVGFRAWLPRRSSRNGIPAAANARGGTSGRCRARWWSRSAGSRR